MKQINRDDWEKLKPKDKWATNCPLCLETDNIIFETLHWRIVHNMFPICGLKNHIMALPKRHEILSKDLSSEEYLDYKNVERYISDYYGAQDYFTFMRETLNGRSLEHLHYHFLPWQIWYKNIEAMLKQQWF